MRHLSYLVLCLVIAIPVLADDGPVAAPQPVQLKAPQTPPTERPTKKKDVPVPQIDDPFGGSSPFETKPADGRDQSRDPFRANPGTTPDKAPAPIVADPFSAPAAPKQAVPGPATSRPAGRRLAPAGMPAAPAFPSVTLEESPVARQRIEAQLATKTDFDYLDAPLSDVIEDIAFQHDLPVFIDTRSLEDVGVGTDTPITISLKGVSLRSALRLLLEELELTFMIRNEVLQITTPEQAEARLLTRFYSVGALLPPDGDGVYLVELVTKHIAPDSWDEVGGPGAISFVPHLKTLAVSQTEDVLHEIDTLLASIGRMVEH